MKVLIASLLVCATAGLVAGCGGGKGVARASRDPAACPKAWATGWQRLANRIQAPVYCPRWMPAPLTGQIVGPVSFGGAGGVSLSVDKDRSYLASFVWAEPQSGEVHVNLRGYPGRTTVPTCIKEDTNGTKLTKTKVPCFADKHGTVREKRITGTVYTVNQDADLWHVLYAWRHAGGLYTVSEHVARPLTYDKVIANLKRILRNLVLVRPQAT
jgi:hypothetical protein